MATQPKYDKPL